MGITSMLYIIVTVLTVLLSVYVLFKTKSFYGRGQPLPARVSISWLIVDSLDILVILLSAFYSVWRMPIGGAVLQAASVLLALSGAVIMPAGMIEFHSARRVLGMETSHLVTTGIYRWSRNPQFLGWYLVNAGIALAGVSGYALLVALLTTVFGHYYIVKLEEPYLERVFGEEYLEHKRRVPRYVGLPKRLWSPPSRSS